MIPGRDDLQLDDRTMEIAGATTKKKKKKKTWKGKVPRPDRSLPLASQATSFSGFSYCRRPNFGSSWNVQYPQAPLLLKQGYACSTL